MRLVPLACALLALLAAPAAPAEKLSKDDEKWLEQVEPLMLPAERELYEKLSKKDREEFKEIFWARRDADPERPKAQNAFREGYMERLAKADEEFRVLGRKGSQTDCGRVLLVLGEPAERKKVDGSVSPGSRTPQDWIYRGEMFAGGETSVAFDEECQLPREAREEFLEQLDRVAESLVRRPALDYELDDEGRLVSLEERLPKPNPAAALLKEPRQDFALEAETKLMMRGQQGATYVAGMLRGDASGLKVKEQEGRRVVDLVIAVEAVATDGSVPQASSLELAGDVSEENRFIASWPLTVPAGNYTARIAVFASESGKGALTNLIFEAPDYGSGLGTSPLLMIADMRQGAAGENEQKGAYAALTLGQNQLITRYGNVFATTDELQLLAFIYNAALDETGKAAVATTFEIKNAEGKLLSKSPEQVFDTEQSVAGVGPVPLASFAPGDYLAELKVNDRVAKVEDTVKAEFSVAGPAGDAGAESGEAGQP